MDEKIYELLEKVYLEVQGVKAEVKQNSNDILRLENKIEEKFSALFDTREVVAGKLEDIETKIDKVASDVASIELITSKNWNDIAMLKKAK